MGRKTDIELERKIIRYIQCYEYEQKYGAKLAKINPDFKQIFIPPIEAND